MECADSSALWVGRRIKRRRVSAPHVRALLDDWSLDVSFRFLFTYAPYAHSSQCFLNHTFRSDPGGRTHSNLLRQYLVSLRLRRDFCGPARVGPRRLHRSSVETI